MLWSVYVERKPAELIEREDVLKSETMPPKRVLALFEAEDEKEIWFRWLENCVFEWGGWAAHYSIMFIAPFDGPDDYHTLIDCRHWKLDREFLEFLGLIS